MMVQKQINISIIGNAKCFIFKKMGFLLSQKPNVHDKIILCVEGLKRKKSNKSLKVFEKTLKKKTLSFYNW